MSKMNELSLEVEAKFNVKALEKKCWNEGYKRGVEVGTKSFTYDTLSGDNEGEQGLQGVDGWEYYYSVFNVRSGEFIFFTGHFDAFIDEDGMITVTILDKTEMLPDGKFRVLKEGDFEPGIDDEVASALEEHDTVLQFLSDKA